MADAMMRAQEIEPETDGVKLADLVDWVDEAEEASEPARREAEQCRRYFNNKQWTAEELKTLRKRGQPPIMENRIRRKVKFMLGWEAQTRSDPRAFAANVGTDDDAAAAVTDALRFQERAVGLDQMMASVWFDMILCGYGGIEVLGPSADDPRIIECNLWRWDRLGHDPHSSAPDFSDARYVYGITWMDESDAIARYPDKRAEIAGTVSAELGRGTQTYDDKPMHVTGGWAAKGRRKRVKIVQMYHRDEQMQWKWSIFIKGAVLAEGMVELRDKRGRSHCPLIMASAYVDEENRRYGEVAEMITLQDEINKRRSKAMHLLVSRQTMGEQGAVTDVGALKEQIARADGHIEVTPGALSDKRFQIVDQTTELRGHIEMLIDARAAFDLIGANATLQGKHDGVASGRAIRASQEGGLVELADIKQSFSEFKKRVYETNWSRQKQFWTEETWINVTDDESNVKFVGFNRPVTAYDELLKAAEADGMSADEAKQAIRERLEQDPSRAAQLEQVVRTENVPSEIDVDVIIEPATESVTLAEEGFQALAQLFPPGALPPDVVIDLWPGPQKIKERVRKRMKEMQQQQQDPQQMQRQQMADQLEADNKAADTEQKRARAARDLASAGQTQTDTALAQVAPPIA